MYAKHDCLIFVFPTSPSTCVNELRGQLERGKKKNKGRNINPKTTSSNLLHKSSTQHSWGVERRTFQGSTFTRFDSVVSSTLELSASLSVSFCLSLAHNCCGSESLYHTHTHTHTSTPTHTHTFIWLCPYLLFLLNLNHHLYRFYSRHQSLSYLKSRNSSPVG